jgi:hypothetical protein
MLLVLHNSTETVVLFTTLILLQVMKSLSGSLLAFIDLRVCLAITVIRASLPLHWI